MIVLKLSNPDRVRPSTARKIDADDDIEPAKGSHGRREHVVQLMLVTAVLDGLSACGAQIGAVRPEKLAKILESGAENYIFVRAVPRCAWHMRWRRLLRPVVGEKWSFAKRASLGGPAPYSTHRHQAV